MICGLSLFFKVASYICRRLYHADFNFGNFEFQRRRKSAEVHCSHIAPYTGEKMKVKPETVTFRMKYKV